MARQTAFTDEQLQEPGVSALEDFVSQPITEDIARQNITEESGMSLSILKNQSGNEGLVILDWAKTLTRSFGFEYVYIFKGSHKGVCSYKIGKTKNIKDRRSVFSVKLPFDIELVALFLVQNALKTEAAIHRAQAHNRVGGEWFNLDPFAFDQVCRHGLSVELVDLANLIRENASRPSLQNVMSDAEYIAYMEGLLAMAGVTFSRDKGEEGAHGA